MRINKPISFLVCTLFVATYTRADQQALALYQDAQQKTLALKCYTAESQKTDVKTGRVLTQTTTVKTLDTGVVLQRVETASAVAATGAPASKPGFVMLSNETGVYYYFPSHNEAIKLLFLPKISAAVNSAVAGLPKAVPTSDQISTHDETVNGKACTVAQFTFNDQQKSSFIQAMPAALQSTGGGQPGVGGDLTNVAGIKYYIDKQSGLLLGQRLVDNQNKELFGFVFSSLTPSDVSDDQFEFPKTTLTFNADSPKDLAGLMFKVFSDK